MKLLKKVSIATVVGKVPTQVVEVANAAGEVEKVKRGIEQGLMRVIGLATEVITGNSTYGAWTGFKGQFQATNILTGEIYRGSQVFLPDTVTDLLAPVVKSSENGVEFAFDIGAKPANNVIGYEYTINHLMKVEENDPLNALSARLLASAPALPAPKTAQAAVTNEAAQTATEEKPAASKSKKAA